MYRSQMKKKYFNFLFFDEGENEKYQFDNVTCGSSGV